MGAASVQTDRLVQIAHKGQSSRENGSLDMCCQMPVWFRDMPQSMGQIRPVAKPAMHAFISAGIGVVISLGRGRSGFTNVSGSTDSSPISGISCSNNALVVNYGIAVSIQDITPGDQGKRQWTSSGYDFFQESAAGAMRKRQRRERRRATEIHRKTDGQTEARDKPLVLETLSDCYVRAAAKPQ